MGLVPRLVVDGACQQDLMSGLAEVDGACRQDEVEGVPLPH